MRTEFTTKNFMDTVVIKPSTPHMRAGGSDEAPVIHVILREDFREVNTYLTESEVVQFVEGLINATRE